jgi:hypothetical protein
MTGGGSEERRDVMSGVTPMTVDDSLTHRRPMHVKAIDMSIQPGVCS